MKRDLIALHLEFPQGEVYTFRYGKKNPVLEGYTVKKIESAKFGSTVLVTSEDDNGNVQEQYFANGPYALHIEVTT